MGRAQKTLHGSGQHPRQLKRAEVLLTEVQKLGLLPVQQQFIAVVVKARLPFTAAVDLMRRAYVLEAIRQCRGNKCAAARLIGIHRNTLERTLKREWTQ